jgi:hypothetical protein
MPSQFRFFGSSPRPDTLQVSSETSASGTSLLNGIRNVVAPLAQEVESHNVVAEPPEDNGVASGLHEVIKSTDVWFNYQLSLLEKAAVSEAVASATAGIPRQDAPSEGELEIEKVLKARAAELFQEWIVRVKRKVQDSVQAACAEAGDKIVQYRHTVAQLERSTVEINVTESSIRDRVESLHNQQKTFGAPSLLNKWHYRGILALLVLIDWIANVPIFTELLPAEFGSRLIWQQLALAAQKSGTLGGVKMVWERLLFHFDVSIFALGVVAFLMLMAHFAGEAFRRWLVFNPEDEPLLGPVLNAQRRQTYAPFVVGCLGIVLAISFLYFSRGKLIDATQTGITQAQHEVEEAEKKVIEAKSPHGELSKVPELQQQLNEVKNKRDDWRERDRFAKDIGMMNRPILLLNIVLALTALTAAYCAAKPEVTEGKLVDPIIPELRSKLASLRLDVVNQRDGLRKLDSNIQISISRAKYLASTRPFAEWEARAQRLNAVVPQFRALNARVRGVDSGSIIAFRQPSLIVFPAIPNEPFQLPAELATLEEEFKKLRFELQQHTTGQAQATAKSHVENPEPIESLAAGAAG